MATKSLEGDNHWNGAGERRLQTHNPKTDRWVKSDSEIEQIEAQKKVSILMKLFYVSFLLLIIPNISFSLPDPTQNSSQLLYTTAIISAEKLNGMRSMGTGFFFSFNLANKVETTLVTNRHVIENSVNISFVVHETDSISDRNSPSQKTIVFSTSPKAWICHPKNLDLCILPLNIFLEELKKQNKQAFFISLSEENIPTKDDLQNLSAMVPVTMIGYPIGLYDEVNNLPILRRGITSSHPAVDFQGRPEGVIDIGAFPGSSGSPVVILEEGTYSTKSALVMGSRFYFLGILWGGPQFNVSANAILSTNASSEQFAATMIPIHLGYYIKAQELLEFKKLFSIAANTLTLENTAANPVQKK